MTRTRNLATILLALLAYKQAIVADAYWRALERRERERIRAQIRDIAA